MKASNLVLMLLLMMLVCANHSPVESRALRATSAAKVAKFAKPSSNVSLYNEMDGRRLNDVHHVFTQSSGRGSGHR
ncbi:UNVERIFIED_CONTAM: hypothetical protein Sradi_0778300 [Sesamum radiatum]|uniref:Uncharacterized protein n=1 Tax=Sesamum radiatum TaxID=300843 RepID=A0AAW2VQM9_SESRA